jgi:hypothetical protein
MPQLEADMTYTDFFKARTELVKALADSARSYIQISSAALALPLLFSRALLAGGAAKSGSYAMGVPWSLVAACAFFLVAIVCGLFYQWLIVRRLWDKLHRDHITADYAAEWGVAQSAFVPKFEWLDRSWLYGGMVCSFIVGATLLVWFAWTVLAMS